MSEKFPVPSRIEIMTFEHGIIAMTHTPHEGLLFIFHDHFHFPGQHWSRSLLYVRELGCKRNGLL